MYRARESELFLCLCLRAFAICVLLYVGHVSWFACERVYVRVCMCV